MSATVAATLVGYLLACRNVCVAIIHGSKCNTHAVRQLLLGQKRSALPINHVVRLGLGNLG